MSDKLDWLREIFAPLIDSPSLTLTSTYWEEAEKLILTKLEEAKEQSYKKGYIQGGIDEIIRHDKATQEVVQNLGLKERGDE